MSRPTDEMVVGRRPALEAVRTGAAREILVAEGRRATEPLRELLHAAEGAGVPVRSVPARRIAELAGGAHHQGVAARVRPPEQLTEGDLERGPWPERALVLVLDGVTDPQNLGAAARSAEAAGASALVLRRRRGAGVSPAAVRASAGALLHLPVARVANLGRALGRLRAAGFWVVGLEAGAPTSIHEVEPPGGRLALVMGSEGAGLSRLVREGCDELASIPMRGSVGSLNVAAAAAVALFVIGQRTDGG
jgi:23S rRNA (guanosine2251-2'-O)-methyltransferase